MERFLFSQKLMFLELKTIIFLIYSLIIILSMDFFQINNLKLITTFIVLLYFFVQHQTGFFNNRNFNNLKLGAGSFFNKFSFSKKEMLYLILTDKFYLYLPLSALLTSFVAKDLTKAIVNPLLVFLSFTFFFMAQNLMIYRFFHFDKVNSFFSSHAFNWIIFSGRLVLAILFLTSIISFIFSPLSVIKNSEIILLCGTFIFLEIQIGLHFWVVENYESKARYFRMRVMTQLTPFTSLFMFFIYGIIQRGI